MNKPFNLCILRLSAIGDVCHAIAMVSAIQQHLPHVKITWVIGKLEYQLAQYVPNVDFVVYDKKGGKSAKQFVQKSLAHVHFDALFVMQVALRANLLSRVIKAKRRIGFDFSRAKEGHSFFINERINKQQHAHVLEGFMGFAQTLGVPYNDKPNWHISIPDEDITWVKQELPQAYAVISPAASKAERNWLAPRYAEVADYLSDKGLHVVLCGGPGPLDKQLADEILACTSNNCANLVGQTSLIRLLAVLKYANMVIAPDTGPAHMATTQNTPVIGLYAHSNPRRTGPYLSTHLTASVYDELVKKQYRKTWQDLAWGKRVKGDKLMQEISVKKVKALIDKRLSLP